MFTTLIKCRLSSIDPEFHLHIGGLLNPIPGSVSRFHNSDCVKGFHDRSQRSFSASSLSSFCLLLRGRLLSDSALPMCCCLWARLSVWAVWGWRTDPLQSGGGGKQSKAGPGGGLHLDYQSSAKPPGVYGEIFPLNVLIPHSRASITIDEHVSERV